MDVSIFSVDNVKPFPALQQPEKFKLCLQDQLAPWTYAPLILFYPRNDPYLRNSGQMSSQLKWSLSKTLSPYYPLSGRVKENLFIDDYHEGVPYVEARVDGNLNDLLQHPQMGLLNKLLPFQPFCLQPDDHRLLPQLAVQISMFGCGGIAVGVCLLHKIIDGSTASSFLKSWSAISSGFNSKIIHPNLHDASLFFPPLDPFPSRYDPVLRSLFSSPDERRQCTRRFVFSPEAIAVLRAKAKSEMVENPTQVEVLSAFIWKSAMEASRSLSSSPRQSILSEAVNIRLRTKPRLSKSSIGNLRLSAKINCNTANSYAHEFGRLVSRVSEGIDKINSEYMENLRGEKGTISIVGDLNRQANGGKKDIDLFTVSSWVTFGFNEIDFGWGKPIWSAVFGEASKDYPCYRNLTILKDVVYGGRKAVEAWVTMDKELINIVENEPVFSSLASLNPSILNFVPNQFNMLDW